LGSFEKKKKKKKKKKETINKHMKKKIKFKASSRSYSGPLFLCHSAFVSSLPSTA
ncbi:hypothetical protein QG37_00751, partial [Candidozyma auris]